MNVLIVNDALDAVTPLGTNTSAAIDTDGITQISMHAILSGATTPDVTVAFYMSNEKTPTNWIGITSGSVTFSDNGQKMLRLDVAARWIEIVSSGVPNTSGGTLTVHVFGNGPN